jgi:hypothetical protein
MAGIGIAPPGSPFVQQLRKTVIFRLKDLFNFTAFQMQLILNKRLKKSCRWMARSLPRMEPVVFNNHDRQQNQQLNNYERINQSRNDHKERQLLWFQVRKQTRRQRAHSTASCRRRPRASHSEIFQTPRTETTLTRFP